MAKEKMSIHDFLEQRFTDEQSDHLYQLRKLLLDNGHIKTIEQKFVYTKEGKNVCLQWYMNQLDAQDEKGSTGSWGKLFEVSCRIDYAIRRNVPYRISDTKCRPAGIRDMVLRVGKGNYSCELKTRGGAVGYGPDKASAYESMRSFFYKNPIIVWDFEATGEPLCMRASDLLEALEAYKGDISTWFFDCPNYDSQGKKLNRSYQIQFCISGNKKIEYLRGLKKSNKAFDWEYLVSCAEFKQEEQEEE